MSIKRFRLGMVGLILPAFIPNSYAADYSIQKALQEFNANPATFMKQRVTKYEQRYVDDGVTEEGVFSGEVEIEGKDLSRAQMDRLIEMKNSYHEGLRQHWDERANPGRAPWEPGDNAADLVDSMSKYPDGLAVTRLEDMERKRLTSAKVSKAPWSDDYWAIYQGGPARRYADPNLPDSNDWMTVANYIYRDRSCSVDDLSPTEKYDLLIGDSNRTLTKAMLSEGAGYAEASMTESGFSGASKAVETWMGHCHGWAPAAYMEKRPSRAVDVLAADGRTHITFYPSDIKALATLLWAKASPKTRFIGQRCEKKDPPTDPATGRVLDTECFDTNPGTWHLAVTNQVGVNKRSAVIDATYDYEVWNQPLYSYSYTYFNPKTGEEVGSLKEAKVSLSDGGFKDKFSKWRAPNARSVVGIAMKLTYIKETQPTHAKIDREAKDYKVAVNYLYDLELDDNNKIIGGEWYHNTHPDFMWTPATNAKPVSHGDAVLAKNHDMAGWHFKFFTKGPPKSWTQAAIRYSSPEGEPLAKIVESLIDRSARFNFLIR